MALAAKKDDLMRANPRPSFEALKSHFKNKSYVSLYPITIIILALFFVGSTNCMRILAVTKNLEKIILVNLEKDTKNNKKREQSCKESTRPKNFSITQKCL